MKRPSVIGKDGGSGENGAGQCLRCHVLGKRESGRTERSMAMSEDSLAPLNLGLSRSSVGSSDMGQMEVTTKDKGLEDLERLYLG